MVECARWVAGLTVAAVLTGSGVQAADLAIVTGDLGAYSEFLRRQLDKFEEMTGNHVTIVPSPASSTDRFSQFRLWLAAGNSDIDVYQLEDQWVPQLESSFLDLKDAASGVIAEHFPSLVAGQTIDGRLVGMPLFADAPALFYRKDLLDKYDKAVPKTWPELAATADAIMKAERAGGNPDMWGFVFQGDAYEGLTCDALEWVKSYGGGEIVEADGTISIDNEHAIAAVEEAKSWIGTIAPPGVLAYKEEESRGVWQLGNAVFMRNWPYAYALGNAEDSPIKGKFDVTPLPAGEGPGAQSAATLATRSEAVSKYSAHPEGGDPACPVPLVLGRGEATGVRACLPPVDQGALRRSRCGRRATDHPEVEGRLSQLGLASGRRHQVEVQRGVIAVLVGGARHTGGERVRCGQPRGTGRRPDRAERQRLVVRMSLPGADLQHIVVMGVSGCGKTTVGEAVAAALGWPFDEGDRFHTEANVAKMAAHVPLTDEDRWPWLQRLAEIIAVHEGDGQSSVMACSSLKRAYRDLLRTGGKRVRFVHLHGPFEVLAARLATRKGHFFPADLLASQYATLEPLGPDEDGIVVDVALDPEAQLRASLIGLGLG